MASPPASPPIDPGLLVVNMCRSRGFDGLRDVDLVALADDSYLAEFEECARRERVFGLILESAVSSPKFSRWRRALRLRLHESLRRMRHQGAFWDLQSGHVVAVLSAEGCEPVLLKGGALRRTVYRSPADRPVADLDILVPKDKVDGCVRALEQLGYAVQPSAEMRAAYEAHHFHIVLQNPQGFVVEVHWDLTPPHSTYRLDPAEFLNCAMEIEGTAGQTICVPRPEHTFLHIVSQLAIEYPFFGRLVDLDRLVRAYPAFDWQYLVNTAERSRLNNALVLWATVLHKMLGTPVPFLDDVVTYRVPMMVRLHLALLEVPSFMTAKNRRSSEAMAALRLWQTPDGGSRFLAFAKLLGRWGRIDEETAALMHGETAKVFCGHLVLRHYNGLKDAIKLIGYQLWLYVTGVWALVSGKRNARFDLWSNVVRHVRALS